VALYIVSEQETAFLLLVCGKLYQNGRFGNRFNIRTT